MPFPVIVFDSATGSNTAASGAGPGDGYTGGSALTGSSASTSGDGLTVTLDGSPDLSAVATDGSHAIWLNDSTAGKRNWGKITGKDDGAKTVTVSDAFDLSVSGKSWAIGGKRLSLAGSLKLFNNNSANGDAMPGWAAAEFTSGYTETITAAIPRYRSGGADGPIEVRQKAGSATPAVITQATANTSVFSVSGSPVKWRFNGFTITKSVNGTTGGSAIEGSGGFTTVTRVKATATGTSKWATSIDAGVGTTRVMFCRVEDCTVGIAGGYALYNHVANCTHAISTPNNANVTLIGNTILNPVTNGIRVQNYAVNKYIADNAIFANTGSPNGINLDASSSGSIGPIVCVNNIIQGCAVAVAITGTTPHVAAELFARGVSFDYNCLYGNGTQITSGYESLLTNTVTTDPAMVDPVNGDFTTGANMKGAGWPQETTGMMTTREYNDIGPQQQAAGGGVVVVVED